MASIIPYTHYHPYTGQYNKNETWILLSQEKGGNHKGSWEVFSGDIDPCDKTPLDTAAREGAEESCEMIGKIDEIRRKAIPLRASKTHFLLNIKNPKTIHNITFQARKQLPQYRRGRYQEKTQMAWVRFSQLVKACTKNDNKLTVKVTVLDNQKLQLQKQQATIRPHFAKFINRHSDYLTEKLKRSP